MVTTDNDGHQGLDWNSEIGPGSIHIKITAEEEAPESPPDFIAGVFDSQPEPWPDMLPFGSAAAAPEPWPWEALPKVLADMGGEIARTFNVPPEMAGAAVLGAASIALGKKARLQIKDGHRQFANVFFLVAAPVAAGKSPVTSAATRPLIKWQTDNRQQYEELMKGWRVEECITENTRKGLERELQKPSSKLSNSDIRIQLQALEQERAEMPVEPLLFCEDFTSEALGRKMSENGGFMGVVSGEGRRIIEIVNGRYSAEGDSNLWLKGHAGDYCRVDRRGGGSYEIPETTLAAIVMTQPDSLRLMGDSEAMRENGFLARWIYIVPEACSSNYPLDSVSPAIESAYSKLLNDLINSEPVEMQFDTAALNRWKVFHDELKAKATGENAHLDSLYLQWLLKQPEHIARLALLFNRVKAATGESSRIADEVENAIVLFKCLESHAHRAAAKIGDDSETVLSRRVWEWIDRRRADLKASRATDCDMQVEAVKGRDLQRAGIAGIKSAKEARAALNRLVEFGRLQPKEVNPTGKKPSEIFVIRPTEKT